MYWYEKDYIMRLIHGISRVLARLFLDEDLDEGKSGAAMHASCRQSCDYLLMLVDGGRINAAENMLFEIIDSAGWEAKELASLILLFYDHVNDKDDAFLEKAGFSRDEIITGMEDAMRRIGMEIPEYLQLP